MTSMSPNLIVVMMILKIQWTCETLLKHITHQFFLFPFVLSIPSYSILSRWTAVGEAGEEWGLADSWRCPMLRLNSCCQGWQAWSFCAEACPDAKQYSCNLLFYLLMLPLFTGTIILYTLDDSNLTACRIGLQNAIAIGPKMNKINFNILRRDTQV